MNAYLAQRIHGFGIGDMFPDIPLQPPNGGPASMIGDLLPNGGLVYYASPGCGSCRESLADLQYVLDARDTATLDILVIAVGTMEDGAQFLTSTGFKQPFVMDIQNSLSVEYGVEIFPTYFCLDENLRVLSFGTDATSAQRLSDIIFECATNEPRL